MTNSPHHRPDSAPRGPEPSRLARGRLLLVAILIVAAALVLSWAAWPGAAGKPVRSGLDIPAGAEGDGGAAGADLAAEGRGSIELEGADRVRMPFGRPPRAGMLFDLESGEVLWRRGAEARVPIASLTKIMTALLVTERSRPRSPVEIPRSVLEVEGSAIGLQTRGKRVRHDSLLNGMLLQSGNDAAIALADHRAGSERRFVRLMNRRARALGLRCTHYVSPHGLEAGNVSCPADLAALARLAMRKRRIARIVRKRRAVVPFPIRERRLHLNTTNPLLIGRYPGTIGLKTGFTRRAGRNLVAVVRRGDRTLGVVLLRSPDPASQAKKLFGAGLRARAS